MDKDRGALLVHQGRQWKAIWEPFSWYEAGTMHIVNLSTQPKVEPRAFSPVTIYPKIGHRKEYFLPLLHFVHNSDRRAVLFSWTSFYRVRMTIPAPGHAMSPFSRTKICFSKNNQRGIFNIFTFFSFSSHSWYVLISWLFLLCLIASMTS